METRLFLSLLFHTFYYMKYLAKRLMCLNLFEMEICAQRKLTTEDVTAGFALFPRC